MQDFYWFILFTLSNGLILLILAINVSRLRIKNQIGRGDGGNIDLKKAISTHANGTEQVPIFSLIILSLEFTTATSALLAFVVVTFTVSRLFHAYGMLYKTPILVSVGAGITYSVQAIAIISLLVNLNA